MEVNIKKGVILDRISKRFGKVEALKNISMSIKEGEFFVILGPSGSGKSTLLRIIAGLEIPDTGRVFINENDVTKLEPKKRNIAMVFQNYALYPHMTVYNNMAFGLKMRKYPRDKIKKRIKEVADMLKIKNLLQRKPKELSGGEKQRVALGRAIVRDPEVFLFDEPLSNLDAKLRVEVRIELINLHNSMGKTSVYVTHDQTEAMTLADRIAIIKDGVLQQLGVPENIYSEPVNTFVAGFIGFPVINFLDVEMKDKTLYINGKEIKEIKKIKKNIDQIVVGIRPEDIEIKKRGRLKGKILVKELLGSNAVYHVKFQDKILRILSPKIQFSHGENISFSFKKDKIFLFDKKTEKKITNV